MSASPLAGKTSREVVLGIRGGVHIAHPLADRALCGASIGERPGVDAYTHGDSRADGFHACRECQAHTYSGGNEGAALGWYA